MYVGAAPSGPWGYLIAIINDVSKSEARLARYNSVPSKIVRGC